MYHSFFPPRELSYQKATFTCKCLAHCVPVLYRRSNFGLTFEMEKKINKGVFVNILFLRENYLHGIYLVYHIKILSMEYLAQCTNLFPFSYLNVIMFGTKLEIPHFANILARASLPWCHLHRKR